MKINVNEIPPQGLELEETQSADELDLERGDIEFTKDVSIKAKVNREFESIRIHLDIFSEILFSCARCLEEESQVLEKKADIIKDAKESKTIDLTEMAREEIIINYPAKLLCSEDCQGLCPQCGRNKNVHTCRCDNTEHPLGINIEKLEN